MSLPAFAEADDDESGRTVHTCQVVLLLGPPASGKTTLGRALAKRFGYVFFDIGAHARANLPAGTAVDEVDSYVEQTVKRVLGTEHHVILVGFPKHHRALRLLSSNWQPWARIRLAIVLEVHSEVELRRRAVKRHESGERPEDDEEHFSRRLEKFHDVTRPVIDALPGRGIQVSTLAASVPVADLEVAAVESWFKHIDESRRREIPTGSSSWRQDADESDIEVSVRLLSGSERLRPLLPARATVRLLRTVLICEGETQCNLRFFYNGQELVDSQAIRSLGGFKSGDTINVTREDLPPPPPPDSWRDDYPVCFTAESLTCVLPGDGCGGVCIEAYVPFSRVQVGDWVRTRSDDGDDTWCRVQRVWAHRWCQRVQTYELAPGCRLTKGHPILRGGAWVRPEDLVEGESTFEEVVYQLEVEGHVDTALVGGVVCALLGRYCGPDFGWNIFTRKTTLCDRQPCAKCAAAFMPGLSFDPALLPQGLLPPAAFEPY